MKKFKALILFLSFGVVSGLLIQCTTYVGPQAGECAKGFVYNLAENRCVPEDSLCPQGCDPDFICLKGKCVPRTPTGQEQTKCAVTCADDEVCENGVCVPAGKKGSECNPPCPQTGFICVNATCKRLCPPTCPAGTKCLPERGVCEKVCEPKCGAGEFCNNGTCQKIEDKDKDGFKSDVDCDDKDPKSNPKAVEICDGKDNNCDGIVDNIRRKPCYSGPAGTLGNGDCKGGYTVCDSKKKQVICKGEIVPEKEICDGKDNDCNGQIDDGDACKEGGPTEKPPVDGGTKE